MPLMTADLNQRSVLALVACDMSYISRATLDSSVAPVPLATLKDSDSELHIFPISLATNADIAVEIVQLAGKTEIAMSGWFLKDSLYDDTTGFSSLFFYNAQRNEYIVAMTGTNGLDWQDWYNNLTNSTTQWNNSTAVFRSKIAKLEEDNDRFNTAHLTFTGQSLGGALAQFAAYDFIERKPDFNPQNISLITFNGLGAYGGMRQLRPEFDTTLLADAQTAHYVVYNDIVSRLGEGNFNAAGNTYLLDFRQLPGQEQALHFVDAHRIEAGFYQGFARGVYDSMAIDLGWSSFQTAAKVYEINYLNTSQGQRLAAAFGQLFNDSDQSPFESAARLVAGVVHGLRLMPYAELQEATFEFITHLRRASHPESIWWDVASLLAPYSLKATALMPPATALSAYSLLLGIAWDVGEELSNGVGDLEVRISQLLPPGLYNEDLARSIIEEPTFAHSMLKALFGLMIADHSALKGTNLNYDASEILDSPVFKGMEWLGGTLRYFVEHARDNGTSVTKVAGALAEETIALAKSAGSSASVLVGETISDVSAFISDVGKGIANAHQDLVTKIVDTVFDFRRPLWFLEGRTLLDEFKALLKVSTDKDLSAAITEAVETIEFGGQTLVISAGHPKNPFGTYSYDPDTAAIPSVDLDEGSAKFFTVFLAYAADEGGQHINLKLDGPDKQSLRVIAGGEIAVVNGEFELVVGEGQREITFVLIQRGDIDADSALTVSATLVDDQGNATHHTHLEVNVTLDGVNEPAQAPTTNDIIGDRAPVDFNPSLPGVQMQFDALGNVITDPAHPAPDRADVLFDSTGNDRIIAGGGDDSIRGDRGGDDQIEAGAGQDFAAGGLGDDQIEGGAGADILTGGAGNDRLFGYAKGTLEDLITRSATESATGVRGDWLAGEAGDDLLAAGADNDVLSGGGGEDILVGGGGSDYLLGDFDFIPQSFNWTVTEIVDGVSSTFYFSPVTQIDPPDGGPDVIYGGAGNDFIFGNAGDDTAFGEAGNDKVYGDAGSDTILGGDGDDILIGDNAIESVAAALHGDDFLDGGGGDDVLYGYGGNDVLYGGAGNDRLYADSLGLLGGDDYLDGEDGIDTLEGGGGSDTLFGGAGDDTLYGDGDFISVSEQGNDYLDGEDGNDFLRGLGGNDELSGGAGADQLFGDAGSDHLDGGAGNDSLNGGADDDDLDGSDGDDLAFGGAGADNLLGGEGADELQGQDGDDYLDGENGNDRLYGDTGNDRLFGAAGNDWLNGGDGSDYISGGEGDDGIDGGNGDDVLTGGAGRDDFYGGQGDDLYIISISDIPVGRETISDGPGNNRLQVDVAQSSISLAYAGVGDAVVLDFGDGRELQIYGGLTGAISTIQFGSQDSIDFVDFINDQLHEQVRLTTSPSTTNATLIGGTSNDFLTAYGAGPAFIGGEGHDWFYAYSAQGGATVRLDIGDGDDRLEASVDPATRASRAWNVVEFGPGITADSIYLTKGFYGSLGIQYGTQGDQIDVIAPEQPPFVPIDAVRFYDGSTLTWEQLVSPGVDIDYSGEPWHQPGTGSVLGGTQVDDRITGSPFDDAIFSYSGNDILDGGRGNDFLEGGKGNDTYLFQRGDGRDVISTSFRDASDVEIMRFKGGVNPADVTFMRYDADLVATISGTTDRFTFQGFFTITSPVRVEFADGPTYTPAQIPLTSNAALATEYADELFGANAAETFTGLGGNDIVNASGGNDIIDGGAGNDTLNGQAGDDILTGGRGWDLLVGGAGNDTYVLGPGEGFAEISDASGTNAILIKAGVTPADIHLTRTSVCPGDALVFGDSLVVQIGTTADQLWISNYFLGANTISSIVFSDGTTWDQATITSRASAPGSDLRGMQNAQTGTTSNNTFVVDHLVDTITDPSAVDVDTALSIVTYKLPSNVENLTLNGTLDISGYGNGSHNRIQGNSSDNRLFVTGPGWDGWFDTLVGGRGDDEYYFNSGPFYGWFGSPTKFMPIITENANEGTDTLYTSWYWVPLPVNVENLTITKFDMLRLDGYTLEQDIRPRYTGNADNNVIDLSAVKTASEVNLINKLGGAVIDGGSGADVLIGSYANDSFVVDNAGDIVLERWQASTSDTLVTPFSASLPLNIENIELVGASAVSATGDNGNNRLNGAKNTAANVLTGGGGDDTYMVDDLDTIVENTGEGNDTVVIDVSMWASGVYSLESYANVENIRAGKDAGFVDLIGNEGDNAMYGSTRGNIIRGEGGNDNIADVYSPEYLVHPLGLPYDLLDDIDELFGGDGNDTLQSYSGSDLLDGGSGDDVLIAGSDAFVWFVFGAGYGSDEIRITGVKTTEDVYGDRVVWTANTDMSTVRAARDGQDLLVTLAGSSDQLRIKSFFDASGNIVSMLDRWDFPDGSILSRAGIVAAINGTDRTTGTANADLLVAAQTGAQLQGGLGNDWIFGQGGADLVNGGDGNDSLFGGGGSDTLIGGLGNDLLAGGPGADRFLFSRGFGQDTISRDVQQAPPDAMVDAVEFDSTILPQDVQISFETDDYDAVLVAHIAGTTDVLRILSFQKSPGNFTGTVEEFRFANGTVWKQVDLVAAGLPVMSGTEGADVLQGPVAATRLKGLGGNDQITGNVGNDVLEGGSGNDLLNGGAGADMLIGGAGDDTYVLDSVYDVVLENANEGTDTVQSPGIDVLGANIENLVLTGTQWGSGGTGNALDNVLTGNSSTNFLHGEAGNDTLNGGAGADVLFGGTGDDTYIVDNIADDVVESASEGLDTVKASVTYTLKPDVENLTLTGTSGINGTGNEVANVLVGNPGKNILTGGAGDDTLNGGANADSMAGGLGDDTYVVDNTSDTVIEKASEGFDTLQSSVTRTLSAEVEKLVLTGTNAINGTGNALDNASIGNSAKNVLSGGAGNDTIAGGGGIDTLTGGEGMDTFVYNALTEGVDTIKDFATGTTGDRLDLREVLVGYRPGTSNINAFVRLSGTTSTTVAVNEDGDGADFVALATLAAVVNNAALLNSMVAQGNLILS